MQLIKTLPALQDFQKSLNGQTLALVPTMGALHAGHVSLVEAGLECADICLPYIYVNPTQFAAGEDLDTYPRTLEADLEKLEAAGAQAVWLPSTTDIYPDGAKITHKAGALSYPLEGEFRPHFFNGVVTVLHRMFTLSKPDFVMMGEKDFQQLQVVRDMVARENMPLKIIGVPTKRDENGLALSSRNIYLSAEDYKIAIQLNKVLSEIADGKLTEPQAHQKLLSAGFDEIDYCTVRNSKTFLSEKADRILVAAYLGKTRLIDNVQINSIA